MRWCRVGRHEHAREEFEEGRSLGCAIRIEQLLGLIDRNNDSRISHRLVDLNEPTLRQN